LRGKKKLEIFYRERRFRHTLSVAWRPLHDIPGQRCIGLFDEAVAGGRARLYIFLGNGSAWRCRAIFDVVEGVESNIKAVFEGCISRDLKE
jgi:hypothetical protein